MTKKQLKDLEDNIVNCQLLHIAIGALEKLRLGRIPAGDVSAWISQMKDKAAFQISQHDEDREHYLNSNTK